MAFIWKVFVCKLFRNSRSFVCNSTLCLATYKWFGQNNFGLWACKRFWNSALFSHNVMLHLPRGKTTHDSSINVCKDGLLSLKKKSRVSLVKNKSNLSDETSIISYAHSPELTLLCKARFTWTHLGPISSERQASVGTQPPPERPLGVPGLSMVSSQ